VGDRPWRKIHLDFNFGKASPGVGSDFDADEFVATLERSRVNAIVVFAKSYYGYCYYPSELGPVLPGMAVPDLLGENVKACRRAGVKPYVYYTINWDELLAEEHPEWLVVKRDRTTYQVAFDERPLWTALCINHPGLIDIVKQHTREVVGAYDIEGMWYDMSSPIRGECYCWRCRKDLQEAGLDPFDLSVQRHHKKRLFTQLQRDLREVIESTRPGTLLDFNGQVVLGLRERVELGLVDNLDIEALPTGGWGYDYFPIHARYARTFGVSFYGQTAKFAKSWGDFGGLKHPTQLRTELAGIVAQGARCAIGDEPLPGGRLEPAIYRTVGKVYAEIERLEPYLEGAVPVTEAAIVVDGLPQMHLDTGRKNWPTELGECVAGTAQLLMEQHVQFDVVDAPADFERYRLVVIPDAVQVGNALAERLNAYLEDGGAVLASHHALRRDGGEELWPAALKDAFRGASPFELPYVLIAGPVLGSDTDYGDFNFVLYDGADRWEVGEDSGVIVHARLNEPEPVLPENTDQYSPPGHLTDYAAVVEAGRLGAASFPLSTSFYRHGYWIYRELFTRLLGRLLPEPLIRTNAPMSAEVTLTHQQAGDDHGERWLVHIVNYSPLRSGQHRYEHFEDPIPLRDTQIALAVDASITRAYLADSGLELDVQRAGDAWQVTVPETVCGSIVVFE